jgi:group I intron endonuclease
MKKVFGYIYKITNIDNGKSYIGQTTNTVNYRWNQHIYFSKNNSNNYLHRAIRKRGIDRFQVKKLCTAINIQELNHREEYCIRIFNTVRPFGYNIKKGGNNHSICRETKEQISITLGSKLFLVRDLRSDDIVGEFINQRECSRNLGVRWTSINGCLKGKYLQAKCYSFSYQDSGSLPLTKQEIKTYTVKNSAACKFFLVRNLDTDNIMEFKSQIVCSEVLGLSHKCINNCLKQKSYQSKNHSFSYIDSGRLPLTKQEIKNYKNITHKKS